MVTTNPGPYALAASQAQINDVTVVTLPASTYQVTIDGTGISKMADLKGKRVSTGAPGSATEVMAFRVLEASGLDKDRDVKRERLGAAEMVPRLLSGREQWCQGFSEPSSGSDLASLQTKAVRDGDEWVIEGWKFFSSNARTSAFLIVMAVTNPDVHPYQGCSMIIVPAATAICTSCQPVATPSITSSTPLRAPST